VKSKYTLTVELPENGDCKDCQFFVSTWNICVLFKRAVKNYRSVDACNALRASQSVGVGGEAGKTTETRTSTDESVSQPPSECS
jgi:hypothetical protein